MNDFILLQIFYDQSQLLNYFVKSYFTHAANITYFKLNYWILYSLCYSRNPFYIL